MFEELGISFGTALIVLLALSSLGAGLGGEFWKRKKRK